MAANPSGTLNDKTEIQAVGDVETRINRISGFFYGGLTNDKTISYDGNMLFYPVREGSKEGGPGKIDVQVKGRGAHKFHKRKKQFGIDRNDLETYRRNEGCMFFVDEIKSTGESRLFYASITPTAADLLLKEYGNPRIRVRLERVPEDDTQLRRTLEYFISQKHNLTHAIHDPEVLKEKRPFTIYSDVKLDPDTLGGPTLIDLSEGHQSVTVNWLDTEVPVEMLRILFMPGKPAKEPVFETLPWEVSTGGKRYYDRVSRSLTQDSGHVDIRIGGSVTMRIDLAADGRYSQGPTTFKPCRRLRQAQIDLEFMRAALESGSIEISGGGTGPARFSTRDNAGLAETVERDLDFVDETADVLEAAGIDPDGADLYAISDGGGERRAPFLHRALVENRDMPRGRTTGAGLAPTRLGDYELLLDVQLQGDSGDRISLTDPFRPDAPVVVRLEIDALKGPDNPDGLLDVPLQTQLGAKQLARYSNLHLKTLRQALQTSLRRNRTGRRGRTYDVYTAVMYDSAQAFIAAADLVAARRPRRSSDRWQWQSLLDAADTVLDEYKDAYATDPDRHLLDTWQIKARKGTLSPDDRSGAAAMASRKDTGALERIAALLISASDEARTRYEGLDDEQRKQMDSLPIAHLCDPGTYLEPFNGTPYGTDATTALRTKEIMGMTEKEIQDGKKFSHPAPGIYKPRLDDDMEWEQ